MSGNPSGLPPPPSYEQLFGPLSGNTVDLGTVSRSQSLPYPSQPTSSQFAPATPPPLILPSPPSFQVDDESAMWFSMVDENNDGRITLYELQGALINFDGKPFNMRTIHFLVRMFDDNSDGTIDLSEFCALKAYIDKWKLHFDRIDVDNSGNIDANEFSQALTNLGYHLSHEFSAIVMRVFGNTRDKRSMNFDSFIRSCAFIHSMAQVFAAKQRRQSTNQTSTSNRSLAGTVSFNFEEFSRMIFEYALTDD